MCIRDSLQILNKDSEIGIDEVGRGSVFGPVFSVAVVLSKKSGLTLKKLGVNDSKKLTPKKRKDVFPKIIALSSDYGLGQSSVREIDLLGIRYATELSMIRAIKKLKDYPSELIIDGPLSLRLWKGSQRNIISGKTSFLFFGVNFLLSLIPNFLRVNPLFLERTTAAENTGPKTEPRPTSSIPISESLFNICRRSSSFSS